VAGSPPLPEPVCGWDMVVKMAHNSLPQECENSANSDPARPAKEVLVERPCKEQRPWWGQLLVAGSPPLPEPVCGWDMVVKMAHNSLFLVETRKSHTCEDRIVFPQTAPLASTVEKESA
jgi:hypothetical protein